jgi:hypothetical protein
MKVVSEEQRAFEVLMPGLLRCHPGHFAVLCGQKLVGVFETVDEALLACSRDFDAGRLPEGAPVFISEIAEEVSLRVTARHYSPGEARERAARSGELRA